MSPMTRAGFADLMFPGLNKVYMLAYESYPEEYTQFLNIEGSTQRQEEDAAVAGFGLVPEKTEGATPYYDIMKYIDKLQYLHKTYMMGYLVTEELYEDELYGIVKQGSKALATAVKQTLDTLGASVLNNAFDSGFPGVDGVELCSLLHPQAKAGGNVANEPAVDCDFDATALANALYTWETWTNDNALPLLLKPKWVVSGPQQRRIITQVLGSEHEPFVNDNEINAVREWELQKKILHYLDDTDAWFILSALGVHFLKWFWRVRPVFRGVDDNETGNAKYFVRFRSSCGFTHWWGVYGSKGG